MLSFLKNLFRTKYIFVCDDCVIWFRAYYCRDTTCPKCSSNDVYRFYVKRTK